MATSSANHPRPRPVPLLHPEAGIRDALLAPTPTPLASLIGRKRDVRMVHRLIRRPDVRLVTLTGPGGVGKTRLALAAAAKLAANFPDGIVPVWLAPIAEPRLVLPAVARELGVPEIGTAPLLERVRSILHGKRLLLVLDNFEQVLPAAAMIADLLVSAPGVKALVTSREMLRVSGEHCFPVLPLSVPDNVQRDGATVPRLRAEIESVDAVRLFVTRARATDPTFQLTDGNASDVAEICRDLDGLPLAIELAAARANMLTPADLLARLDRRLPLLTDGPTDQPERLRTMRGAIRWSYELLSSEEQWVFERLAVCANGFSLDAAEHMAAGRLALVASLIDKNLLRRDEGVGGSAHFAMLETIREFALEQLHASGAMAAARSAHAVYYLAFAERWAPDHFRDHDLETRLEVVEAEYDNVRAALAHLLESDTAAALRLAGLLPSFWYLRTRVGEGREWLERAISGGGTAAPRDRVAALNGLGMLTISLQDLAAAKDALARAHTLAKAVADIPGIGFARMGQAVLAIHEGDFAAAAAFGAESEAQYASIDDAKHAIMGRFAQARAAQYAGDLDRAEAMYRDLLSDDPDLAYPRAIIAHSLALAANTRGDHRQALIHAIGALGHLLAFGELWGFAGCLDTVAVAHGALGQPGRAARLFAAAASARSAVGTPMIPADHPWYERAVAAARGRLGEAAFAAEWEAGSSLSPTAAFREVLADVLDSEAAPAPLAAWLTPREVEVLRLVAAGQADKEIARTLAISRYTVSNHLTAMRAKLAAPNRTAAVTAAREAGLL